MADGQQLPLTFRPATRADEAFLVDALAKTFPATPREHWPRLFSYPWLEEGKKPDFGTVAESGGDIVGFLGAMYAQRVWSGDPTLCCHVIGWWVDPTHRGAGIGSRLVDAYLEARRHMPILLLTLRPDHMGFWGKQGVQPFDERRRILFEPLLRRAPDSLRWHTPEDVERGVAGLGPEDLRVWRDHRALKCHADVFSVDGEGSCLVVSRRRTVTTSGVPGYRWLMERVPGLKPGSDATGLRLQLDRARDLLSGQIPCAEILYVSHKSLARRWLGPVARKICKANRALAVVADERRLDLPERPRLRNPGHYYAIPNGTSLDTMDALYAEFLLLDM